MYSLIGAVLIVCGLYMVLWGKSKEMKKIAQLATSKIAQETEDIEVVVMPTLEIVDHDKIHVNNNHKEVDKDHVDYLSKNREISSSIGDDQEIEKSSTN
jgi:inner membrane protein involved in colicin E2 resistance